MRTLSKILAFFLGLTLLLVPAYADEAGTAADVTQIEDITISDIEEPSATTQEETPAEVETEKGDILPEEHSGEDEAIEEDETNEDEEDIPEDTSLNEIDTNEQLLAELQHLNRNSDIFLYFVVPVTYAVFIVWKFLAWFERCFVDTAFE